METKEGCHVCGRKAYFHSNYLKKGLCRTHFERMLVSRARSSVISAGYRDRTFKLVEDGSAAYVFLSYVFREDGKNRLTLKNSTLEDFAAEVLGYFINGRKPRQKIASKKSFNPLYTTSEKELAAFASLKGLKTAEKKRSSGAAYLIEIAEDVEKRRPGAMISSVKMGKRMGLI